MKPLLLILSLLLAVPCLRAADAEVDVTFLDADSAARELLDDRSDPYFDKLQPPEMTAKSGSPITGATIDEQRAELRRRYRLATRDFSPEEKEALKWYVGELKRVSEADYPVFASTAWSFLKVSDTVEGGLPHTRGRHIVLPEAAVGKLVALKARGPDPMALLVGGSLLFHEQLHVVQRFHRDRFEKLYREVWGLEKTPKLDGCPWLEEHQVTNPDGIESNWVFAFGEGQNRRWILPLIIFGEHDGQPRMPDDLRVVAVELRKSGPGYKVIEGISGRPAFSNLSRITEYSRMFPHSRSIYHPNEAAADLFANVLCYDNFMPKDKIGPDELIRFEKDYEPYRKWFRENLR